MHTRRSNSLTGTAKVSDLNGTTSRAKPKKATSLDVATGVGEAAGSTTPTSGGGLGDGDSDQGRPPPPGDLASTALTVAHNAYVTIETRADELLDRLDETFEAIENGPIGQTAINTVHRVGEVIDDRVLKRVKLAPEVEEVLHGIENTEVVRVAIEKVREAKDYGERILTRLGSQESEDESAGVDFVIPPNFVKAQTPYSDSFVLPHTRSASFDQIDPYIGTVDVSLFTPDLSDDISYKVPGGFVDLTPDDSDRKNHHLLRQRNDSLCSVADSEPYFEFVKSNPTFRSPPYSQQPPCSFPRTNSPDIFDPRKSILVQCNQRGEVKNALIDVPADSNGRSNDFSVPSKYNGGENPRFVRFIERYGGGARGGADSELCPSTKAVLEVGEEDPIGGQGLPDSVICGKAFTQYNTSSNSNSNDVDETSPLLEKGRRLPSITEAKKRTRNDQEKHRHLPACPPRRRRRLLPPIPQKQPLPHPNLLKQDKPRKLQRQDSKHPKDEGEEEPSQEKPAMQYLQVPPRIQPQAPPPPTAPKPKPRTENLHLYIPGVGFPQDPNRPLPLPNVRQGVKLSGLTEEQILDKFHGRMHDLVCIDGEMYYIVKKAKRKGALGVFGGASMLLEGSSEDNLDKLSGGDD